MATSEDVLQNFWPTFEDSSLLEQVECTGDTSDLATDVLDEFGVAHGSGPSGGLPNLDIKRMDALTVVNLALMEYAADTGRGFIEPIVDEDGIVQFVEIGRNSGQVTHEYYQMQTASFKEPCRGVLVTGARPIPVRKPIDWKPMWGEMDEATRIYSWRDVMNNCHKANFSRYANIVFNDPNIESEYEDGIDNLYEIGKDNPYDRIIGYAIFRDPPKELMNGDVSIDYVNQATIPIQVGVDGNPSLGILQKLPRFSADDDPTCWDDPNQGELSVGYQEDTAINIPTIFRYETVRGVNQDKLLKVSGVYVVGQEIDFLCSSPQNDAAGVAGTDSQSNLKVWVTINDQSTKTLKLRDGTNYVIVYDEDLNPSIAFAADVRENEHHKFGTNTTYFLDPFCDAAQDGNNLTGSASILPLSKTRGFKVQQIWATVDLDTPSVVVHDPSGGKALEIATALKYYLGPMVVVEEPAPTAFNGVIVDQTDAIKDHDPTTAQDFENSAMEDIQDAMQGGGMTITMSFLDGATQVEQMSQMLYNHMTTAPSVETVYTCDPNCKPKLGGDGNAGGIVNSIQYSYTDSGSYTISVQEGGYLVGNLAAVDGGPTQKMAEDIGCSGTVISDLGNGIHFKIRLDGYGDRWAVAMCHNIIRVGDRVNCTIHNNPVEA